MSTLVWPTGDGDTDCQEQAEVFGQFSSVWQCIMSTVCSCWECVTCGNLDTICFMLVFFYTEHDLSSPRSEAKASGWLQSAVTKTDVTLQLIFIAECGIARFLCTVHVCNVWSSSSPPKLPLCQILCRSRSHCWAIPWRKIAHTMNVSVTPSLALTDSPAYLMPREPKWKLSLWNLLRLFLFLFASN